MNPHKVSMLAAAFLSAVVLLITLVVWRVQLLEAVFRAGLTFVLAYGAVFFLAHQTLRIVLREAMEQKRKRKRERAEKIRARQQKAEEEEEEPEV